MSARTPEHPAPPDARALLVVVDAARQVTGGRDHLANAVANHPASRELDPQVLRRTLDSYADAIEGFRLPRPSAGYVAVAFYALRARVARWLGIPFLALLVLGGLVWGIPA
ncbi:MAG TPA: hypothetical protein VG457_03700, partial [Planctomycetota bacterium]|nr:hypothetical protein [Planctomycetota bacterium]